MSGFFLGRRAPASQSHLVINTACADHTLVTQERQLGVGEESSAPGVESCTRGLPATAEGRLTAASLSLTAETLVVCCQESSPSVSLKTFHRGTISSETLSLRRDKSTKQVDFAAQCHRTSTLSLLAPSVLAQVPKTSPHSLGKSQLSARFLAENQTKKLQLSLLLSNLFFSFA